MRRKSLTPLLVTLVASAAFAGPAQASTAVTGDPWIDQYIEQVPTATGNLHTGNERSQSGLSQQEIAQLAASGGQRFASVTASTVPPSSRSARRAGSEALAVHVPSMPTALVTSIDGDGGLGPVLPAALIGGLIGAVAFAISRSRRRSN
jgi:hypothetical protein